MLPKGHAPDAHTAPPFKKISGIQSFKIESRFFCKNDLYTGDLRLLITSRVRPPRRRISLPQSMCFVWIPGKFPVEKGLPFSMPDLYIQCNRDKGLTETHAIFGEKSPFSPKTSHPDLRENRSA